MTARTWAVDDRIAVRDRTDQRWELGTVTGIRPADYLAIRYDDHGHATIRHPDDPRVVPVDEVPVDERWWVPQQVRDQLVRQEAAGRLRAMAVVLDHDDALLGLAALLDDVVGAGGGGWLPTGGSWASTADLADAARALLTPAPGPADDGPAGCDHGPGDTCRVCLDAHLDDEDALPTPAPALLSPAPQPADCECDHVGRNLCFVHSPAVTTGDR